MAFKPCACGHGKGWHRGGTPGAKCLYRAYIGRPERRFVDCTCPGYTEKPR